MSSNFYRNEGLNSAVQEIAHIIQRENETLLLDQLNDFVSRGLIVIESTQPTLVQDPMSTKLRVLQTVKLTLKDKEYIEKLEKENKELNKILSDIKEFQQMSIEEKFQSK